MDPLTGAAIAVGSIIATKALEKTGEKVGEKVWQQTEKFLTSLKVLHVHELLSLGSILHCLLSRGLSLY